MSSRVRLGVLVLAFGFASAAMADDAVWLQPAGGTFGDAGNWSGPVTPPGGASTAHFGVDAPYTVQFGADATNAALRIENGDVVFDLGGHTYTLTSNSTIGNPFLYPTTGSLEIRNGTVVAPRFDVDATRPGAGGGTGVLRVGAGGRLFSDILLGPEPASTSGSAIFEVVDGGFAQSVDALISDFQLTSGSALVDGLGSKWVVTHQLVLGSPASSLLTVRGGGSLETASALVDAVSFLQGASTAVVTGAGSSWTNAGLLTMGENDTGILRVEDAGVVRTRDLIMGHSVHNGKGQLHVDGAGSLLHVDQRMSMGGELDAFGIDFDGVSTGIVSNGGHVEVGQSLALWNQAHLAISGGRFDLGTGGPDAQDGQLRVHADGRLLGTGTIVADVSLAGALDVAGSGGAAGDDDLHPARLLTIDGALTAEDGAKLTFDLAGEEKGKTYDALSVAGAVALSGALEVTVLPAELASLDAGDSFTVLESGGGLSGAFANVAPGGLLATAGGEGFFQVFYGVGSPFGAGNVVLTNFSAVPEPGTLTLVALGVALMPVRRVRAPAETLRAGNELPRS